jgi:hypothetical protein
MAIAKTGNRYEVSNYGRVRHRTLKKCLRWSYNRDGYPQIVVFDSGKVISMRIHREVALAFIGIPYGRTVNHKDGNKRHNHVDNLEYLSVEENNQHRSRVLKLGFNKRRARLTAAQVAMIRQDKHRVVNNEGWARRFGVTRYVIRDVRSGRTYKAVV